MIVLCDVQVNVDSIYLQSGCSSVTESTSADEMSPMSGMSPTSVICRFDFNNQDKTSSSDFDGQPTLTKITPTVDLPSTFVLPQIPNDETFGNYSSILIFRTSDDQDEGAADDEAEEDGYARHYVTRLPEGRFSMAPRHSSGSVEGENEVHRKTANYYITVLNSDDEMSGSSRHDVDGRDAGVNYVHDLVFDEVDEEEGTSYVSSTALLSTSFAPMSIVAGIDNEIQVDAGEEPDSSDSYCVAKII